MATNPSNAQSKGLFGHPKGLFTLFFVEMWERLAFYTMVGILLLYTIDLERGGLGLPAAQGNEIYGLYLAFVYFTPFIGGMIADRFLGYRKAVLLGGLMMATGLFLMSIPGYSFFLMGLIGLILGNGFFKPNISVMVGNLYETGDPKRDAGFNIFYMGINIGALVATLFMAPMLRNVFGWLWVFRGAGFGLLISVAILLVFWRWLASADRMPERSTEDVGFGAVFLKILLPAFTMGILGYIGAHLWLPESLPLRPAVCGFLVGAVPVLIFFVRLGLKAKPEEKPGLLALLPIYVAGGAFFMILHLNGSAMTQWAKDFTNREASGVATVVTVVNPWSKQEAMPSYYVNAGEEVPRPHPDSLLAVEDVTIARMYGQQRMDGDAVAAVDALPGIEVVTVDEGTAEAIAARSTAVYAEGVVTVEEGTDSHGAPTVSVNVQDGATPDRMVAFVRDVEGTQVAVYLVDQHLYSEIYDGYKERFGGKEAPTLERGKFLSTINAEVFQSWNPLFVILLTPVVVGFFAWRMRKGKQIPTAYKLVIGMGLTTLALLFMSVAGLVSDNGAFKVSGLWLMSFYVVVTLGELCLSPMGLSLVTKLSPKRLVGLTMGGWFLATAFGNNFSGFFGGIQGLMDPLYFFLLLAGVSALVMGFLIALLPKLNAAIQKYGA